MKQKHPQHKQTQPQQQQQEKPTQDKILQTTMANRWKVRVRLFEGEEFIGTLQGFDMFTLTLMTEENRVILLYKHSVKYLEPLLP